MNKKVFIGSLIIAFVTLLQACGNKPKNTFSSGITTVMCDESFENIISQEIEMFEYHYPKANIMPYYMDEQAAVDSLMELKTQLIIISNKLSKAHEAQLKLKNRRLFQQRLAVDAIALIVNNQNTLDELSISELRDILLGQTTNWDEIEPSKLKKIQVVFDHKHSSIVKYMVDSITDGKPFAGEVYAQQNSKDVLETVSKNKNAIGLIGVSWITPDMRGRSKSAAEYYQELQKNDTTALDFNSNIKVLKIRRDDYPIAYKPYQAYIFSGDYPLYRSIYVASTAARGSLPHGFLTFLTGYVGQKIIQNTGVLPAAIQPRMVQVN
ncbi:MAG: phosphate ABC transporter substrate-binding protein [Bacteroidales bacterium]|nr:phosphate ABC transporter substrate-binding protein [Bacteroidales bacterium]